MSITEIDVEYARVLSAQEECARLAWDWEGLEEVIDLREFDYCSQQVFHALANGDGDGIFPFDLHGQRHLLHEVPIVSIEDLAKICQMMLHLSALPRIVEVDLRQLITPLAMRLAKLAYRTAYFKRYYPTEYAHAFHERPRI